MSIIFLAEAASLVLPGLTFLQIVATVEDRLREAERNDKTVKHVTTTSRHPHAFGELSSSRLLIGGDSLATTFESLDVRFGDIVSLFLSLKSRLRMPPEH